MSNKTNMYTIEKVYALHYMLIMLILYMFTNEEMIK